VANEDVLRSRFYGLLALLLARSPEADLLDTLGRLAGDSTPMGKALAALAEVARGTTPEQAEDEFGELFVGLTEGQVRPYGSYYRTGFLYEKPLADLRWELRALGIDRADGVIEPEDHIALLLEVMCGLIVGAFGDPADLAKQKRFFEAHIAPWADRFFADLESAPAARVYRKAAAVGREFLAIEREAFALAGGEGRDQRRAAGR
jgi:TorA maturation chaperone TorD